MKSVIASFSKIFSALYNYWAPNHSEYSQVAFDSINCCPKTQLKFNWSITFISRISNKSRPDELSPKSPVRDNNTESYPQTNNKNNGVSLLFYHIHVQGHLEICRIKDLRLYNGGNRPVWLTFNFFHNPPYTLVNWHFSTHLYLPDIPQLACRIASRPPDFAR